MDAAARTALLFEANPTLTPAEVEQILASTAEPMAGRAAFEVGAGHADAFEAAAVAAGH